MELLKAEKSEKSLEIFRETNQTLNQGLTLGEHEPFGSRDWTSFKMFPMRNPPQLRNMCQDLWCVCVRSLQQVEGEQKYG